MAFCLSTKLGLTKSGMQIKKQTKRQQAKKPPETSNTKNQDSSLFRI